MSGATSFTSVPIVDISGLRSRDRAERERVAGEIGNTLFRTHAGVDEGVLRAAA